MSITKEAVVLEGITDRQFNEILKVFRGKKFEIYGGTAVYQAHKYNYLRVNVFNGKVMLRETVCGFEKFTPKEFLYKYKAGLRSIYE